MRHGSLFNGIGGFQLAAEWMGWENVMSCEIDKFCNKVTKYHFPNCIQHGDIKTTDFSEYRGRIDIVTGGFPCQPYSQAGKRKGKEDDRHLWPEMLRAIKQIRPSFVVGENVPGLLNWKRGMVLYEIVTDLEAAGFEVFPPLILPACGKNAGHKRERLWIVAYNHSTRFNWSGEKINPDKRKFASFGGYNSILATNNNSIGVQGELPQKIHRGKGIERGQIEQQFANTFQRSDSFEPKLCRTLHGLPNGVDRIKALGNAIVPQVAYEIFKAIEIAQ